MKTIATINFKGGAGKTTVSWLMAKYLAKKMKKNVLIVDTDPQMSLTLAVQLEEDKGVLNERFDKWNHEHKNNQKTLLSLMESFEKNKCEQFNFSVNNLIYKMSDNLHMIPSNLDLYWLDYDINDKDKIKSFIRCFLSKLAQSNNYQYDYVFFDCPPSFNALTYSVLNSASMVLMPVNPDVMALRSMYLLIEGLAKRLKPATIPKISVFMNKAKTYRENYLTADSKTYLNEVKRVRQNLFMSGINIDVLDSFIPEYNDMKHALTYDNFPDEYEEYFHNLWASIDSKLNEEILEKSKL